MKRILKTIGLVLALPLLAVAATIGWVLWQVLINKPGDDEAHMRTKAQYLRHIAELAERRTGPRQPNLVIVYYDDLGYGDLGFTGSKAIKSPNIDALAADGLVLANYHSPSPVCSPSRAGLLTGRLPPRAAMPGVTFPSDSPMRIANYSAHGANRLTAEEVTLADVLKADGYRTGMIGKWHLGDVAPSLPNRFGFQSFYGALYSNDMEPFAVWRNEKVEIAAPADQERLDRLYTGEAVKFISKAARTPDKPFFLYFAHNFPHEPLHTGKENLGRSAGGLYGDIVEGLDDGIGKIVGELRRTGQFDNTIIVITSDNGPWFQGSPGFARGRKGQTFEGGQHVPFLIHWTERIPGHRTLPDMAMGTDLFPTLCDWLGLPLPTDRKIDGASLAALFEGTGPAPRRFTYFYSGNDLLAVSDGRFKYLPKQPITYAISGASSSYGFAKGPWLFDLSTDPDESYDVSMRIPGEAKRLKAALDARNAEMRRNPRGWQ